MQCFRIVEHTTNALALTQALIDADATESQERALFDLFDDAQVQIHKGTPMSHGEFERRVYDIFPIQNGDYHSAEGFVTAAAREGKWIEVYEHMRRTGMNLPASVEELRDSVE
jgi:hypothetical protein